MTQTPEELAAPLQKYIHASTGMWPVVSAYQGGWVKADEAAAEITALQARIAELEARAEATEAALTRAWERGRDDALAEVQDMRDTPSVEVNERAEAFDVCCDLLSGYIRALTPPADLGGDA